MEGLSDKSIEVPRRRYPVSGTTDGDAASFDLLPISNEADPPRPPEASEEDLREVV